MIKRIKIRDFKSIGELDLELDPVTVLVGRSGTGKSNIVQAIRFLRNLLLNSNKAINNEGGWGRIAPAWETKPKTSIEVLFDIPGEDQEYRYLVSFGPASRQEQAQMVLMGELLSVGEEVIYSRSRTTDNSRWAWTTPPPVVTLPQPSDVPMLGHFPSLQQVVFANVALSTGIGYYHFPSSTLSFNSQPPDHAVMGRVTGLADHMGNYKEVIRSITEDFHHPNIRRSILASLQAVNPSILSIEFDSTVAPPRAIVGHKAGDQVFPLDLEQESDGLRRFYSHLLALYQTPAKLALIFEEPENAIFQGALSLLAEEFEACPRENRGQVILTTHSPGLLDSFDVESVRVVDMRDGKTIAGKVSKKQRDDVKDHLHTTGELLTVDKARIDEPTEVPQLA